MVLALFASLLFAAQPVQAAPPSPAGGQPEPVTTEAKVDEAAEAADEASEAAREATEEATEEAGEAADEAREAATEAAAAAGEAAEEAEERTCRRLSFYDDFGRLRSRKSCRPR